MRIAFDGTTLTAGRTGVGYYTEHLLRHLATAVAATGDELVVISNRPIETDTPLPAHVRVHTGHQFPVRAGWLQGVAPRVLDVIRPDVAHFTNGMLPVASAAPAVVTVHDLSLRLYPRFHPVRRLIINRPLQAAAIRRAAAIVAVSHSTRRDLLRLHGVRPERVTVVHEAASDAFQPISDSAALEAVRTRFALPERFILYVGTVEPRKNLRRLVEAFAAARRAGIRQHLVCVGPYGWRSADLSGRIEALGIRSCVHFTGYVPFDVLPALYNLSDGFAFPSIYEGFGLPVVEAMACGTPVVTSNSSSLAEIAADAALTVDPLDTAALARALERLAMDVDLRAQLSAAALARSSAFSWTQAADAMLALYRQVAGGRALAPASPVRAVAPAEATEPASVIHRGRVEVSDGR